MLGAGGCFVLGSDAVHERRHGWASVEDSRERCTDLFALVFSSSRRMFETFSFLPPLSDAEISKQVQYLLNNGWTPCIEFEDEAHAYADGHGWSNMDSSINAGYYDNRYWVMWKLPMYGCTNTDEVLAECKACTGCLPGLLRPRRGLRQHQASPMRRRSWLHRPPSGAACAVDAAPSPRVNVSTFPANARASRLNSVL